MASFLLCLSSAFLSATVCASPLPDADIDLGGVTFDFVRMSAARHAGGKPPSGGGAFALRTLLCDELDGTFAVSKAQVGEIGFVISTADEAVRKSGRFSFRLELPRGIAFVDATFAMDGSVRISRAADGSSAVAFEARRDFSPGAGAGWEARYVLVAAEGDVGDCGYGRLMATCSLDGQTHTVASRPIRFTIVPEISVSRPRRYANGSFCGGAFDFGKTSSVERLARFMAEAGVSWLLPPAALRYPQMPVWRRHGFRIVTPVSGGWCANGYQLGDGGEVPWTDSFTFARPPSPEHRFLVGHSVCPMSVIGRTEYCRRVVEPEILRHLRDGVDGLWANWEPYMFSRRGCGCERCGRAFAEFLGCDWPEIFPEWPDCSLPGGRLPAQGRRFRSALHGMMLKRLDSLVRTATGGARSLGLIPGIHFEQMLTGWRKSPMMRESCPADFAGALRWVNPWGPYLPWHTFLPYEEERGRSAGHWLAFSDLRTSLGRDYPAANRPKLLAAPQGTCDGWLTQPEDFERTMDAAFFNRMDACCPWVFPAGADARYWRAFANATAKAARYEPFVFGGTEVGQSVTVRTVCEYAAPVARVLANMPWAENVRQLQANAYERDGVRIVALFNGWEKGEAFVSLSCRGMSGNCEIVSDDGVLWTKSRAEPSYSAEELAAGVTLAVGASRCRVFEIRPAGSASPAPCRAVMTEERVRRLYAERRATLRTAAAADRRRSSESPGGMIRYD